MEETRFPGSTSDAAAVQDHADGSPQSVSPPPAVPAAGIGALPPPDVNGDIRLIWKLKGTSKKSRRQIIADCVKGQPVFIICDPNGANCTVITEQGEELGRLNEQDSRLYHQYIENKSYHVYIKRLRLDEDKPRVKILLLLHDKPLFSPEELNHSK